jgi:hypothetical protein
MVPEGMASDWGRGRLSGTTALCGMAPVLRVLSKAGGQHGYHDTRERERFYGWS